MTMWIVYLKNHDGGKKGKAARVGRTLGRRLCEADIAIPQTVHLERLQAEKDAKLKAEAEEKAKAEAEERAKAEKLLKDREEAEHKKAVSKSATARSKAVNK